MNEIEELLKQIEELRRTLYALATKKKLSDPEVVTASQMLDALLNEYEKLIKRKKEDK
ncbi:Spo0E like sporulation regulatory protein [Aneurinibacillus soli]|uniref:Spo0E like sporulation regulatory protein n=1 Tax=Aneurinibacillus soli TaxID=1500254 RepID=A0A0U5AYB7_9BACL|nr:aspartyl-phosphate phosphatase Spo0E family protein [Aneurinibacillus soli]PYE62055.1 Spo0E like sporulation regulatory protein [Aneurinibacillus soli]BAU28757.1 Spo0E like sporulation regulatory protein [Aneurinibacillus soli]